MPYWFIRFYIFDNNVLIGKQNHVKYNKKISESQTIHLNLLLTRYYLFYLKMVDA
jgi:hypothetical protein